MSGTPAWSRVKQVFHSALDHPEAERIDFVRAECGSDRELCHQVESLLLAHAQAGDFAERSLPPAAGEPSRLQAGDRIGAYQVLGLLGAGGMGTVYRARDARLNRDVALKLLPREWSASPDRLARFEREARMLASLSHPHVGSIYGLEDAAGVPVLVLELIPGETLAERIRQGPIPIRDALAIARQIGEALEAAHDQAIVHRDLKPANIKITPDGTVKVLDFGLAKPLVDSKPSDGATMTMAVAPTQTGVILGTPAYMSPEQARGQLVDKRTDVWAFGCVLFEMLTGRAAFTGPTVSDTLSQVLDREPDWTALPARTPPLVRRLLVRCLEKDVRRRLRDISDAHADIDDAIAAPVAIAEPRARWPTGAAWATALAVCVIVLGGAARFYEGTETGRVVRMSVLPPPETTAEPTASARFVLSPDGSSIVMSVAGADSRTSLWIRPLDSVAARPLPGTENGRAPFWSPDSRSVGFFADGKLKRLDVSGGPATILADAPGAAFASGAWSGEDVILFSSVGLRVLQRVRAAGGPSAAATTLDASKSEVQHYGPVFLPDGRHFLFVTTNDKGPAGSYVGTLDSDERQPLLPGGSNFQFAAGRVLFVREGALMAQAFDPASLRLAGDPQTVAENLIVSGILRVGAFSVSGNGLLAYQTGPGEQSTLTWVDRAGRRLYSMGGFGAWISVALSGDDRYLAAERHDGASGDLWIIDAERNAPARFTFSGVVHSTHPVWSRDGSRVAFQRGDREVATKRAASGSVDDEILLSDNLPGTRYVIPRSWSVDGRWLVLERFESDANSDLWLLPLSGSRQLTPFLQTPYREVGAQLSPDGRWIAYASNASGRSEIYVRSFPRGTEQWQISMDGGEGPRWRGDGRELYYFSANRIFAVDIDVDGTFGAGEPRPLFNTSMARHPQDAAPEYAVSSDGQRFLVILPEPMSPITVVVNWPADLEDDR